MTLDTTTAELHRPRWHPAFQSARYGVYACLALAAPVFLYRTNQSADPDLRGYLFGTPQMTVAATEAFVTACVIAGGEFLAASAIAFKSRRRHALALGLASALALLGGLYSVQELDKHETVDQARSETALNDILRINGFLAAVKEHPDQLDSQVNILREHVIDDFYASIGATEAYSKRPAATGAPPK